MRPSSNLIKGFFFATLFALLTGCTPKVGSSAANNSPNALPQDAAVLIVNLHLGNSVICRMTNYSRHEVRIYREGSTTLWAKTGSKASIPFEVKFGEEYYVRCNLQMGVFVGEPNLRLIDNGMGEAGYEVIKDKRYR